MNNTNNNKIEFTELSPMDIATHKELLLSTIKDPDYKGFLGRTFNEKIQSICKRVDIFHKTFK